MASARELMDEFENRYAPVYPPTSADRPVVARLVDGQPDAGLLLDAILGEAS